MTIFLRLINLFFFGFHKWFLEMLYYDRTDASEGIDPAKRNNSKECIAFI